ncbi:MAG: hypothetical protein QX197_02915 [Methylococcaceae bacterium]
MLKKLMNTVVLTSLLLLNPEIGLTVEHPPGHGSGGGAGGQGCQKVGIRNMKPVALTEVPAGSEFSVIVFGANFPDDIEVTAKKILVATTITPKDDFFVVSGKLPPELHTTAARINVKIKGKSAGCTQENGWLIKITE